MVERPQRCESCRSVVGSRFARQPPPELFSIIRWALVRAVENPPQKVLVTVFRDAARVQNVTVRGMAATVVQQLLGG